MSERDEFERFVTDKFFDIEKDHIGYTSWATAFAWKVWQDTRAAARATPQQAMQEGWKLVPVEPTESMRLAPAKDRPGFSRNVAAEIYRAMLAAAPQPSQEPEKAERQKLPRGGGQSFKSVNEAHEKAAYPKYQD